MELYGSEPEERIGGRMGIAVYSAKQDTKSVRKEGPGGVEGQQLNNDNLDVQTGK